MKRVFWFECRYSDVLSDVVIRTCDSPIKRVDKEAWLVHTTDGQAVPLDEGLYKSPQDALYHNCMAPLRVDIEDVKYGCITNVYGAGFVYKENVDLKALMKARLKIALECTAHWKRHVTELRTALADKSRMMARAELAVNNLVDMKEEANG